MPLFKTIEFEREAKRQFALKATKYGGKTEMKNLVGFQMQKTCKILFVK